MMQKKIHFIGIGGIGMSGLARYYLHEGWQVSGSDSTQTPNTEKLVTEGAQVVYTQVPENISDDLDLVVYTEAMATDHPELAAARAAGHATINYFEALGRVANPYYLVAVAGTHGKTTTTAMLADIFEEASYDPTVIVGSLRSKTGSNYRAGQSKYAVVEACEYKRDFLYLEPDVLVITNLEHEHVDYYRDLADVQDAFRELAMKVPDTGYIVADTKDPNVTPVLAGVVATVINYNDYLNLTRNLTQPGLHNRQNAAAAEAAAAALDVEEKYRDDALKHFVGTARRFEYKGDINNAPVYDDYAHHPTEIVAAIAGTREKYPDRTLQVVFQSHTYSRTKQLFTEFIDALEKADQVVLLPIYAAREVDDGSVSSAMIRDALLERGVATELLHTEAAAAQQIKETVTKNDVVLCVGAGSVTQVATLLTT